MICPTSPPGVPESPKDAHWQSRYCERYSYSFVKVTWSMVLSRMYARLLSATRLPSLTRNPNERVPAGNFQPRYKIFRSHYGDFVLQRISTSSHMEKQRRRSEPAVCKIGGRSHLGDVARNCGKCRFTHRGDGFTAHEMILHKLSPTPAPQHKDC